METAYALEPDALQRFVQLRNAAVDTITARFYSTYPAEYARFGEAGRKACREDIEFQLDFLKPVLEFGLLQPYVDYQRWFAEVLAARSIAVWHIETSLGWLGEFFAAQMPGGAGDTIAAALAETGRRAAQPREAPSAELPHDTQVWLEAEAFEAALLEGNRRRAQAIVAALKAAGHSIAEIDVHVIQVALYDIGEKWLHNKVSVAQEHLATATARTVMAEAFASADFLPPNGRKAIFACVEGNQHALGLQMVADAFELEGWEVQCLGANTPINSLVAQVEAWRPDLVGLSIAFAHQLATGRETIRRLRERLGDTCPRLVVGGAAVNAFKALTVHLGADGHASDALAALSLGRPAF